MINNKKIIGIVPARIGSKGLKFKNANECKGYQTVNADGLDKGLRSVFPNITELNIQCVNNETLEEMQRQIVKQDKE